MPFTTIDYLRRMNIYPTHKGVTSEHPKELFYRCLFHKPDNDPSMRVNTETGKWYCDACDTGGNLPHMVSQLEFDGKTDKRTWALVFELLTELNGGHPTEGSVVYTHERPVPIYASEGQQTLMTECMYWWHARLHDLTRSVLDVRSYLVNTVGAKWTTLQEVQVGYAPSDRSGDYCYALMEHLNRRLGIGQWEDDALSVGVLVMKDGVFKMRNVHRVMFSCTNEHGRVMFFQGRAIGMNPRVKYKYLNAKLSGKYPFRLPVQYPIVDGTIVTESPKGPLVLAGYGIPALATLGPGVDERLLDMFHAPFFAAQDSDEWKVKVVKGQEVQYRPGEAQAQEFLSLCRRQGKCAYRLEPPRLSEREKGVDEWIAHTRSEHPLVEAMGRVMQEKGEYDPSIFKTMVVY